MSHFCVLVIGDNVEEQLAPYDEKEEVEPYFDPMSDDEVERMASHFVSQGDLDEDWDLEDLVSLVHRWTGSGGEIQDGQLGRITTYNPKSKWDWWTVGGRYSGYLKLTPGGAGITGRPGVPQTIAMSRGEMSVEEYNERLDGHADVVEYQHVDWEGMQDDAAEDASETWDQAVEILNDELEDWGQYDNAEEALEAYSKEDTKPLSKRLVDDLGLFLIYDNIFDYLCLFDGGREAFVEKARLKAGIPYAIVKDGEWYQKGEMGWWGMSTDEMSDEEWHRKARELLDDCDSDTLITVVDCHI